MRIIQQLSELQALDLHLDADRKRYAELQTELQEPESLRQARGQRQELAGQVEHWQRERRQREGALAAQGERIQAQEQLLYSGRVRDAREQVALQQNVEALQRHRGVLEDAALEAMLELEQAEADLAAAEDALGGQETAWQRRRAQLEAERQALIARARKLKAARDAAAGRLQPAVLAQYERLRQKSGVVVAMLQGENCGGCGALLPTAIRQQAHGDALVSCPICGRLLHG